ncbi:MAG: hypothetical protein JWM12_3594, partial [Ilumatobacteraceae bacterium]|nr:hypothetical protein [Ilumatobacteraceae bacterium]
TEQVVVTKPARPLPPAFYAAKSSDGTARRAWADWWLLLHPPYTLWHLGYVAIGATIAPQFNGTTLIATLLAFFLAVGLCAHALDELHDRPLRTRIPSWQLVTTAALALCGSVALGVIGVARVGPALTVFIAVGVALACAYNLELFRGRLHNDLTFAAAWGAFPVLTAYYAQAHTLGVPALLAAGACYLLSNAQRSLSTPARTLRRRVTSVHGELVHEDGRREPLTTTKLLAPLEAALKATAWGVVALSAALVVLRVRTT